MMDEDHHDQFEDFEAGDETDMKYLLLIGQWGMANRLRCFNVGYELAQHDGRTVIAIDDINSYQTFWGGDWTRIAVLPFEVHQVDYLEGKDITYLGKANDDCGVTLEMSELESHKETKYVAIKSCEIVVPNFTVQNLFYKIIQPTSETYQRMSSVMTEIGRNHNNVVGVHIRQGNIPDYRQQYFFGDWKNDGNDLPLFCCFDDKSKNMSSCRNEAIGLEKFIVEMEKEPAHIKFFICSDRPGCILSLEKKFPKRLLYNRISIDHDVNYIDGFCDWWCLAHCGKMLLSGPSSFSVEATKVNNVNPTYLR
jgi:hypothetical protein